MNMEYEVVTLSEKKIVGVQARTSNLSPEMSKVIGGLWEQFYQKGVYAKIDNKANMHALGIYSNYANKEMGEYDISVACEVTDIAKIPEEAVSFIIPAGRYARFHVVGDAHLAVAEFWGELWKMELPRSFTFDFEEYCNQSMEQAEVDIYIALRA